MTQEEKDLLLKDLCSRLPYGVKVEIYNHWRDDYEDETLTLENYAKLINTFSVGDIKPYLFPLSSMTEEQLAELKEFADLKYEHNTLELVEWGWNNTYKTLEFWLEEIPSYCVIKVFDWLDKNNFDYRGLIPMGLAIDATHKNIY